MTLPEPLAGVTIEGLLRQKRACYNLSFPMKAPKTTRCLRRPAPISSISGNWRPMNRFEMPPTKRVEPSRCLCSISGSRQAVGYGRTFKGGQRRSSHASNRFYSKLDPLQEDKRLWSDARNLPTWNRLVDVCLDDFLWASN
jgi:hypothetical protein